LKRCLSDNFFIDENVKLGEKRVIRSNILETDEAEEEMWFSLDSEHS
jgi:hypothetical protein